MKILPISVNPIKQNNYNYISKPINKDYRNLNIAKLSNIYYPVSFQGSIFSYKPISFKKPDYDYLNCDYSAQDEFLDLYTNKINSQLRTIDYGDVLALISRIKMKTGADEKLIIDILYQLTMYSNYNALNFIQETAAKLGAGRMGIIPDPEKSNDISINTVLFEYFANNKHFLHFDSSLDKSMIILDGILLDELEDSKKNDRKLYDHFISQLNSGYTIPVILKGFDIECSDKRYRSTAFLYGSGNIEGIAIDTIRRVQKGENLDDILYLNMKKRYKNLIADDVDKEKQKVKVISPQALKHPNKYSIYRNLKRPKFEIEKVKSTMEDYLKKSLECKFSELAEYLDEFSVAYSFDSMACELKKLHRFVNDRCKDSDLYVISTPNKSEILLTHLYCKVNNIPPSKVIGCIEDQDNKEASFQEKGKKFFIIDDMSLSGETIMLTTNKINNNSSIGSSVNFGLLLLSNESTERLYYSGYSTSVLYTRQAKTLDEQFEPSSKREAKKLPVDTGFNNRKYLIVFPYIIPDNCSDIAGDLFGDLLIENSHYANKAPRRL